MSKKELQELIKIKELELKELKDQLKEFKEMENNNILTYTELVKLDQENMLEALQSYDMKDIRKIMKQGSIVLIPHSKDRAITELIQMINIRSNKGWAFKS